MRIFYFSRIQTVYIAAVAIIFFCLSGPAHALQDGRYTESEKTGFAFHKLSNSVPDFAKWVREMDDFKKTKPAEQEKMMKAEVARLKSGFYNYQPDHDMISISFDAMLKASQFFGASQKYGKDTDVTMELTDLPDNYFPFYVAGTWIAAIVKDFDAYTSFVFSKDEYAKFAGKAGLAGVYQRARPVKVDLLLRPVDVDTSSPVRLDKLSMWLMLMEIAEIRVWRPAGAEQQDVYSFKAPWYTTPQEWELLRLYRN